MEDNLIKKDNYNYEDNVELLKRVKTGDKEAMNRLMEINLPLVASISKKFINRGYDYEDLFQIGSIGLLKAANNFDPKFNVKFSTYAVPMIIGEIKRFLRDDGIIKVSRSVKKTAKQIHYEKEVLTKKLNRSPTLEEISEFTGISIDDIIFATESTYAMQYLFDTVHQDDGSPVLLIDKLSEEEDEHQDMLDKILLKETLEGLDDKYKKVIMLRYFKDKTQVQIAKILGISQVQVSRIEKKVIEIIKEKLKT